MHQPLYGAVPPKASNSSVPIALGSDSWTLRSILSADNFGLGARPTMHAARCFGFSISLFSNFFCDRRNRGRIYAPSVKVVAGGIHGSLVDGQTRGLLEQYL